MPQAAATRPPRAAILEMEKIEEAPLEGGGVLVGLEAPELVGLPSSALE